MSGAGALIAAMADALAADPTVAALAQGIETDRREPGGALPALTLAELQATDWSTKTEDGVEVLVQLTAHARAGRMAEARALLDAARGALAVGPPGSLAVPGWQLVSLAERGSASAVAKGAAGPVRASADLRARLLRRAP